VLSAKYSIPEIARRELELTANAVLLSAFDAAAPHDPPRLDRYEAVMRVMARVSEQSYRGLVYGDEDFSPFFHAVTPVDEISRLQLGSRPAKRRQSTRIEDFRAIPWVFSWTQARVILPAWYGLGTALAAARAQFGLELLREMEHDWPFFSGLLSNAEMACAKTDLDISTQMVERLVPAEQRHLLDLVRAEHALTVEEVLRVLGQSQLLDDQRSLRQTLRVRDAFLAPLHHLQMQLLQERRRGDGDNDVQLHLALLVTVNGIAAGMRNTG